MGQSTSSIFFKVIRCIVIYSSQPTFFNEILRFYLKQLLEAVRHILEGYGLVNENDWVVNLFLSSHSFRAILGFVNLFLSSDSFGAILGL
jgi:hypothetical protein